MKKMLRIIIFALFGLPLLICCERKEGPILPIDGDGNQYDTLIIGTQVWLKENLKTTRYNNGDSIPFVSKNYQWYTKTSAAFCWYDNSSYYKNVYGGLYNWYAVNEKNICPLGYHVPTVDEWLELIAYLGGENVGGGKLKESGFIHWQTPNSGATNESRFKALPGGQRSWDGNYSQIGQISEWWTSSASNDYESASWMIFINYLSPKITNGIFDKNAGYSVRCIKDE